MQFLKLIKKGYTPLLNLCLWLLLILNFALITSSFIFLIVNFKYER